MTSEETYQKAFISYCICLYDLEMMGWDLGEWPTYEQFKVIYDEEAGIYH